MKNAAAVLAEWEAAEVARANLSGRTPVVFVHGLFLLSSSWRPWRDRFEEQGFTTIAPGWPDDPATVQEANEHPELFAKKMVQQVTDHYVAAIAGLTTRPAVIGHSFGGLIAQKIAGAGSAAATVAIDNAPFRGVLPLPPSALKSAAPLISNPANISKARALTFEQFQYGWANNLSATEARELYERYHVPAAALPLFQAATANFNPFGGDTTVDHKNPDRGPMLIIAGEKDHTVPPAISAATFKIQSKNAGVTEFAQLADRGHTLTIDHGWREVADIALAFIKRFV